MTDQPAPDPAPLPEVFVLLAETLADAHAAAAKWLGWEVFTDASALWHDHHSNLVLFLEGEARLLELAANRRLAVYTAHRWYACTRPHILDGLVAGKRARMLIEPPHAPQEAADTAASS